VFRLREILEDRGIRQKDLAQTLGLPQQTLSNYVTGKREADYETLGQICATLGVTADYLLGRSTNPAPAVSDEDAALLRAYHSAPPSIVAGIQALLQPYTEEKAKAGQAV
jgi:transcriptional regulator with XRE-family HTH domain